MAGEPPDPISDPRVHEIISEVTVEVKDGNKPAEGYVIGEEFNYYSDKNTEVNVVDDIDDDGVVMYLYIRMLRNPALYRIPVEARGRTPS